MFERILDALPDGVLVTDGERGVVYANEAFARHWRIPQRMMQLGDELSMLDFVTDSLCNPKEFHDEVERLYNSEESASSEVVLKDGRVFSRRSVPAYKDGALAGRIWIFTDITEARSASTDALTGVRNRRAYLRDFPAFVQAQDCGLLRSVALLDIDNFKGYNDTYGHAAGDEVLQRIGEILICHLPNADDLVFRMGGDEFLLACHIPGEVDVFSFFETIRRSISDLAIPHTQNAPWGIVTTSMGLDTFRSPESPVDMFEAADAALYQAKSLGRNRLIMRTSKAASDGAADPAVLEPHETRLLQQP